MNRSSVSSGRLKQACPSRTSVRPADSVNRPFQVALTLWRHGCIWGGQAARAWIRERQAQAPAGRSTPGYPCAQERLWGQALAPQARRDAVRQMVEIPRLSDRSACRLAGLSRVSSSPFASYGCTDPAVERPDRGHCPRTPPLWLSAHPWPDSSRVSRGQSQTHLPSVQGHQSAHAELCAPLDWPVFPQGWHWPPSLTEQYNYHCLSRCWACIIGKIQCQSTGFDWKWIYIVLIYHQK